MAVDIFRKFNCDIRGKLFSIMVDETTDISNTEQLVFCIRYVDEQLNGHENFIGLQSLETTTSQIIVQTIDDNTVKIIPLP